MLKGGPFYNEETICHSSMYLADGARKFTIFGGKNVFADYN